jgi:hypothetical protein
MKGLVISMENEPTSGQLTVIGYIEKNTGLKFNGKTKEEAREFISGNIDKSKGSKEITEKQQAAINACCELISGISFTGTTKAEAREFLMLHIDNARGIVAEKIEEERKIARELARLNPRINPYFTDTREDRMLAEMVRYGWDDNYQGQLDPDADTGETPTLESLGLDIMRFSMFF